MNSYLISLVLVGKKKKKTSLSILVRTDDCGGEVIMEFNYSLTQIFKVNVILICTYARMHVKSYKACAVRISGTCDLCIPPHV